MYVNVHNSIKLTRLEVWPWFTSKEKSSVANVIKYIRRNTVATSYEEYLSSYLQIDNHYNTSLSTRDINSDSNSCQRIFGITFFWTRVCSDWFVKVLISKNDFRIYFPSTREAWLTTWALGHRWFDFEGKGGPLEGRFRSPRQSALRLHDRTVSSRRLVTSSKLQRTSSQSHQLQQRACCTLPKYCTSWFWLVSESLLHPIPLTFPFHKLVQ